MELRDVDLSSHTTLKEDNYSLIPGNNNSKHEWPNESSAYSPGHTTDDMSTPVYILFWVTFFNSVVFVVGVFGNVMVIIVVTRVRDMRTATNYFLLSLSVADCLVLLVCQPTAMLEFYSKDRWFLGEAVCKLVPLLENGVLHASIMTICAVTAERYYAICYPFKNKANWEERSAQKAIVMIWVAAFVCTTPFTAMTHLEDALFYDGTPIKVCRTRNSKPWMLAYSITLFVVFFALPFFVLIFVYCKIIKQLVSDTPRILTKKDQRTRYVQRSRKQVVRMLILIIALFFASLFPMRVVGMWLTWAPVEDILEHGLEGYLNIISFARLMMYLNSAGNPIIYSLTSTKFKHAFKRVLCRKRSLNLPATRYSFVKRTEKGSPTDKKDSKQDSSGYLKKISSNES